MKSIVKQFLSYRYHHPRRLFSTNVVTGHPRRLFSTNEVTGSSTSDGEDNKASDDDDGNILKDESLSYTWYAAVGEIISGSQNNIATWTAPQQSGKYSISCSVSDQSNGEDIKTIEVIIQ